MAFLFSRSVPVIQMISPLHLDQTQQMTRQTELGILESCQDPLHDSVSEGFVYGDHEHKSGFAREDPVQTWTVDEVVYWLQENVPFQHERMAEICQVFVKEGIDGLRLLTLQRNNPAVFGMTDAEWLLLYGSRESLMLRCTNKDVISVDSNQSSPTYSSLNTPKKENLDDSFPSLPVPSRLNTSKSLPLRQNHKSGFLKSSLKFLSFSSRQWWSSSAHKYEKKESLSEVFSLQEEILSVEEREAALKAKMEHLDEILRTAQLANYLYTRMRWTPLPGELPVDDSEVDDWIQRFLVLEGSTLFYFPQAADLRPEGAILFSEVVDVGPISGKIEHDGESIPWSGFQVTTVEGLRLECATSLKLQADLWMSLIKAAHSAQDSQGVHEL